MSIFNTITDYLRSAKNELTKVTWPTRKETVRYSALVISISVGVAVFFGILDMGLSNLVTTALANKKLETPTIQESAPIVPTVEGEDGQPIDLDVQPIQTPGTSEQK